MKFFHRISDEDAAKQYAQDVVDAANKIAKEHEDKETMVRIETMRRAIENDYFFIFYSTNAGGFTIYSPMDKAEQAQDIVRSIMAAMHMQEANEEAYQANKNDKHPGYA